MSRGEVCAIVVNWNGWRDTIVCVESLCAQAGWPLRILVCDNGSSDGSAERLRKWIDEASFPRMSNVCSIDLLQLPGNLGYAGGANAGIRWAQARGLRSFWLLNNDVQAQPGSLLALLQAKDAVPDAGVCGSVLLDWDRPQEVQAVAGMYRRWLGVGWHLTGLPSTANGGVFLDCDYPVGASMFVEQDYLEHVGLMDESYFLYCEEMDWVERGRRRGWRPVIALDSRLRHKEGASTGSRGGVRHKSLLSERYGVINRLRITRKFWPHWLPVVWLSLWAVGVDRLLHREFARAGLVLSLMFSPRAWLR